MRITKESIEEVSSSVDIVNLIGEYVNLQRRGSDWWGLCPFHTEKTPSFSVSPSKHFYHCFGCGSSGSVFDFVMEMEKVSFAESVETLAKRCGVTLQYEGTGDSQQEDSSAKLKGEYKNLYTRVAGTFHYMLTKTRAGKFALDYALSRGLSMETIEQFKLGYSPRDRGWLKSFLLKKNYSEEFLQGSGLFSRNYPDMAFFSDRLMFPIFDKQGEVVAFGGRFLRGDADKSPKYLNSGELIHYKKGETLYAFNFAKGAIREKKAVLFCEGYMDCIAYHQCGVNWAVAPLGTSLTEEQIKLVKHFVQEIHLSFDSDDAGKKAARRAILMCRKNGLTCKLVRLEGGKDPAEIMVKFGSEVLTKAAKNTIFDYDYLLSALLEVYPRDAPEGKSKACLDYFEFIDCLQSDVQKDACLDRLCQAYGIQKEAARKDYANRGWNARFRVGEQNRVQKEAVAKVKKTAELQAIMTLVCCDQAYFQKLRETVSIEDLNEESSKRVYRAMEECLESASFGTAAVFALIDDDATRRMAVSFCSENGEISDKAAQDSVRYLELRALKNEKRLLVEKSGSLDGVALEEVKKSIMGIDFKVKELKTEAD